MSLRSVSSEASDALQLRRAGSSVYRPDIDGLRAIAVLAVVGFHAEIAALRGGFSGVDIFFVISGYLISGIIFRSLERGSFSFAGFYTHRINRIFPALGVVLVAVMFLGWFVLFPPEFSQLGKHVAGGAGFVSNFLLWSETGYFDSKNKLLLHLWSLGVEEQFYIVWPLFLVIAWKRRWNMMAAILLIAVTSFAVNVWVVEYSDRTFAFYSPTSRLWELLAGALLSWREVRHADETHSIPRSLTESSSAIGLAAIAMTLLLVNQDIAWPGWWALLPVAGVLLIIGPGAGSFLNRRLLSNRILVGVGLISYPLYLWHWPLLVLARLVNEAQLPRSGRIGIVGISIALAWLTYEFVEKPIRFGERKRRSAAILLPMTAAVGLIGISVANGLPKPFLNDAYRAVIKGSEDPPRGSYFNRSGTEILTFVLPGDSLNTIALVGDSHATQYWPRFDQLINADSSKHPQVILLGYGGCPPFPEANQVGTGWDGVAFRCPLFHKLALEKLASANVRTVMYAACWECYFNDKQLFLQSDPQHTLIGKSGAGIDSLFAMFDREIGEMVQSGKRVFIVLPNPNSPVNNPLSMLPRRLSWLTPKSFRRFVSRAGVDSSSGYVRERLLRVASHSGAVVIDPLAAVCGESSCSTVTSEGNAIYQDDHHFRADFARHHASFVDTVFSSASAGERPAFR